MLAEEVVSQALRGVGRQLLMSDDKVRQYDTQQSRYSTCSLAYTCTTTSTIAL